MKRAREEVVAEVMKAPGRRVDNMITRLYDSARLTKMHTLTIGEIRRKYRSMMFKRWIYLSIIGVTGPTLALGAISSGLPIQVAGLLGGASVIGVGVFNYINSQV